MGSFCATVDVCLTRHQALAPTGGSAIRCDQPEVLQGGLRYARGRNQRPWPVHPNLCPGSLLLDELEVHPWPACAFIISWRIHSSCNFSTLLLEGRLHPDCIQTASRLHQLSLRLSWRQFLTVMRNLAKARSLSSAIVTSLDGALRLHSTNRSSSVGTSVLVS